MTERQVSCWSKVSIVFSSAIALCVWQGCPSEEPSDAGGAGRDAGVAADAATGGDPGASGDASTGADAGASGDASAGGDAGAHDDSAVGRDAGAAGDTGAGNDAAMEDSGGACADGQLPAATGCEPAQGSGTTVPGQALTLAVAGSELAIPADALPPGLQVSVRAIPIEDSDFVAGATETPISYVTEVSFSERVDLQQALFLRIDLPPDLLSGFYGYEKLVGAGGLDEASRDEGWTVNVGRFNAATPQIGFALFDTAATWSIVVVRRTLPETPDDVPRPPLPAPLPPDPCTGDLDAPSTDIMGFLDWDFAVICDLQLDDPSVWCDPEPPSLAQELGLGATSVEGLGFTSASFHVLRRCDLERADLPYATWEHTGSLPPGEPEAMREFIVGYLLPDRAMGDYLGLYSFRTGKIQISERAVRGLDPLAPHFGDLQFILVHELMHAVQASECSSVAYHGGMAWVLEGTADTGAVAASTEVLQERLDYRHQFFSHDVAMAGEWRDWNHPLASEDPPEDPYLVSELWLNVDDGSISYLPELYRALGPLFDDYPAGMTELDVVSAALEAARGDASPDLLAQEYIELIKLRDLQEGYPHCEERTCDTAEELCVDQAALRDGYSARCIDLSVNASFCAHDGPASEAELELVLDPEDAAPLVWLLVNGELFPPGAKVTIGPTARVWLLNLDSENLEYLYASLLVRPKVAEFKPYPAYGQPKIDCVEFGAQYNKASHACGNSCCYDGSTCKLNDFLGRTDGFGNLASFQGVCDTIDDCGTGQDAYPPKGLERCRVYSEAVPCQDSPGELLCPIGSDCLLDWTTGCPRCGVPPCDCMSDGVTCPEGTECQFAYRCPEPGRRPPTETCATPGACVASCVPTGTPHRTFDFYVEPPTAPMPPQFRCPEPPDNRVTEAGCLRRECLCNGNWTGEYRCFWTLSIMGRCCPLGEGAMGECADQFCGFCTLVTGEEFPPCEYCSMCQTCP